MIPNELKDWLDENGNAIFCEEEPESPIPAGWEQGPEIAHYGGEDQGSEYWTVWKFINGDISILIRLNGWYQSYNGSEYEGYEEVVAKEKTVTVYEKI